MFPGEDFLKLLNVAEKRYHSSLISLLFLNYEMECYNVLPKATLTDSGGCIMDRRGEREGTGGEGDGEAAHSLMYTSIKSSPSLVA